MDDRKNLKILQHNINGMQDKKDELEFYLNENKFNIAVISETHGNQNQNINVSNFDVYIKCRDVNVWGGVAVLIRNDLRSKPIVVPTFVHIEIIGRFIECNEINLLSVYIPPGKPSDEIKYDIEDLFEFVDTLQNVILAGDLNGKNSYWGCNEENKYGELLLERISNSNLIILNNGKITRINRRNPENSSAIDLTLVSSSLFSFANWDVDEDNLGSDHQCIKFEINFNDKTERSVKKVLNVENAIRDVNLIDLDSLDSFDNLITSMSREIKKNLKNVDNSFRPKPWWSDELKKLKEDKIKAIKEFNSNSILENIIKVNRLTAELKRGIKKAKIKSWLEFLNTINPFTNITEIWHAIQRIEGKGRKRKRVNLLDDLQKGKEFMDRFYTDEDFRIPKTYQKRYDDDLLNLDLLNEILDQKKSTAPGEDGITYDLLRKMDIKLKEKLVSYMNEIWKTGDIPAKLKRVNIIAILKPNKAEEIGNLRPISLIPVIVKIMNSVIKKRMIFIVETSNCLPRKSFGFRKNLSTTDSVTFLTNEVMCAKREKKHIAALFVDIKSAFDNVNIDILYDILSSMKIPDQFCIWIYNFLINRNTSIKVGSQELVYNVCKGLPQGDVLSPDLFNLYTRKIHSLNSQNISIIQFADDIVICVKEKTKLKLNEILNSTVVKFMNILNSLQLQISPEKTVLMPFFMREHEEINVRIGSIIIAKVINHCWLGFNIDFQVRFGVFIRTIRHKLLKKLDVLKKLAGTTWGGHPQTMDVLYKGIMRNQLEYGCVVYNSISKTYENMIETITRKALRLVNGFTKSTPVNALHLIAAEEPHFLRRKFLSEKYITKIVSNDNVIHHQLKSNLKKEIEWLEESVSTEIQENFIIIHTNNEDHRCQKNKYSNSEYTFLSLWSSSLKNSIKVKNNCYKNLSLADSLHPLVFPKIEGMVNKKSEYKPVELKNLSMDHLKRFSESKFIFTDASRKFDSCSVGIYMNNLRLSFGYRLRNSSSIMIAELHGIRQSLVLAEQIGVQEPVILTDSINSCFVLSKSKSCYKLYPVVHNILMLAKKLKATIQWIPSHVGIEGNEKADEMAKKIIDEELFVEIINNNSIDKDIINLSNNKMNLEFQSWYEKLSQDKGKITFGIMPKVTKDPWYKNSKLSTEIIKMINRILTNHAYTPKFLKMMKVSDSDLCDICNCIADVEHIVFKCIKYVTIRQTLNMQDCDNIFNFKQKFNENFIEKLASFIRATKIKI